MCSKIRRSILLASAIGATLLTACSSMPVVERVVPDEVIDLSGRWNDTDSRLVSEEMIEDVLARPWTTEFQDARGSQPTVIVGTVRNESHEHLNTETFVKDLERELLNSGRVRFVASRDQREEVRAERDDQREFASLETMKAMGKERGADFMLVGQINSIIDAAGNQQVRFYQIELELIDLETNEKVWIGQKKLKKLIEQPRHRF